MRILLMCHFPLTGSGSGVYTLNIAHALTKLGHEVRVVIPENQEPEAYEPFGVHPVYFNGCTNDALPFNFPCFTTHPRSVQTFQDLSDEQLAEYEQAFRSTIEEEIRDFAPEIIHCGHAWLLPHYALDYGIPVVITVHGTDLIGYEQSERFHNEAAHALEGASAIVTISKENDQRVRRLFPTEANKCRLILNSYNADVFYPDDTTTREEVLGSLGIPIPADGSLKHMVSFAGKFAHFKGIDILIRGIATLQERNPEHRKDTMFILAGDGELFEEMCNLASDLEVENIHFVHNQPHDMLRRIYSTADISLLTSRKEPFGLVIIEAMACGAPVIGSDDGGAVDIITPDVGLLFESENPEDLATKLESILSKDHVFDRDVVASYAKGKFSQDESIHELIDIYEAATEKR